MTKLSWDVYKISSLITSYDKLLDKERYDYLDKYSEKITHATYSSKQIVNEEYMHFYVKKNERLELIISPIELEMNIYIKRERINILFLRLCEVPNIKFQCKDKVVQMKYYINWEKKYQITFYSLLEMNDFKIKFDEILFANFNDKREFIEEMNILNGDVEDIKIESTKKTSEEIKKEFKEMVNK